MLSKRTIQPMNVRPIAGHSSIVSRAMTDSAFVMVTKYKNPTIKV
jgi:hypothetical protein